MRPLVASAWLLFSATAFAQSDFCEGWKNGYQQGWCFGYGSGCGTVTAPMCPSANYGESSYADGYNRGLLLGKSARETPTTTSPSGITTYQYDTGPVPVATYRMPTPSYPPRTWQPVDPAVRAARREARISSRRKRHRPTDPATLEVIEGIQTTGGNNK